MENIKSSHTKVCTKCLCVKPLEQFEEAKAHGHWCRKCYLNYFKEYNKKRYSSPEARVNELQRCKEKYQRVVKHQRVDRKRKLLAMFGGKCVLCGYAKSSAALDFDHLDENGNTAKTNRNNPNPIKSRTISHLLARNAPGAFELAIEEAKKCRIICANCHREQTFPGHGMDE